MCEKSGSLSLGRHRAGRTAKVEIDLGIPEVMQCIHRPDAVRGRLGEQLRNRRHALVVLRQDIALLPRRQLFIRGRCDKRHEILVHTRKKFVVRPAIDRTGHAFHRRKIIVHGAYHSSEPSSGMTAFIAVIATSIMESSGSNTVRCCTISPGQRSARESKLSERPA